MLSQLNQPWSYQQPTSPRLCYHGASLIRCIFNIPTCQKITGAIPQYNYVPIICPQPHCGMYYVKLKFLLARTPPYQPYTNSASHRHLNNFRDRISCSPLYHSAILCKHQSVSQPIPIKPNIPQSSQPCPSTG